MSEQQSSSPLRREEKLQQAYQTIQQMSLGEREAEVKLALKALLLIRGSIRLPETSDARSKTLQRLYPAIVKYIRASESQTLGALINEVIGALSPDWSFVSHKALGDLAQDVYREDKNANKALHILKEETVPLVILMKKIYQSLIEPQEASEEETQEADHV